MQENVAPRQELKQMTKEKLLMTIKRLCKKLPQSAYAVHELCHIALQSCGPVSTSFTAFCDGSPEAAKRFALIDELFCLNFGVFI
jgi:hypothetical protein